MEIKMTQNTTQTYGEVSWGSGNTGDKGQTKQDFWLRLDEGDNELRFVTAPYQYLVHRYKKDKFDKIGQKIPCSAIHGSCPLCSHSDDDTKKVRRRWLVGVISRKTGTYRVLDISWAIFSQIKDYNNDKRWGEPSKYDVNIVKNSKATSPADWYRVIPLPKEPLSAADQLIKDKDVDLEVLKKRCTPPVPEKVQEILNKINGAEPSQAKGQGTAKKAAPAAPVVSLEDDGELGSDFPDYTGSNV
jgi:hypothetical protein